MSRAGAAAGAPRFLFGVDVEDERHRLHDGARYPPRVPMMTQLYLNFLERHAGKGTFFIVGDVARAHPDLVGEILERGHEVACHSDAHVPLDRLGRHGFREDTLRGLDALGNAGAGDVQGYRAPCFSLTESTRWAYEVLAELGFSYSSSVLPARNPHYGWSGFGEMPRIMQGVVELPITLLPRPLPRLPMGGVYFRALPRALVRDAFERCRCRSQPVLGYFHPYDADAEQSRFVFPGFSRFGPSNWLMYRNRGQLFDRLDEVAATGFRFEAYRPFSDAARAAITRGAVHA